MEIIKRFKLHSVEFITPVLLFLLVFIIYLHNLSVSVYAGDVGDFLTAIVVKGVPHPSGYPLFTLLGIIANMLPFYANTAWKVGLISVFSASLSVVLMYLSSNSLVKNKLISSICALTLAFFYPFWLMAEIAEVFALAYFFILLLFYLAISYYKYKKKYLLYLLCFSAGLSLANNEVVLIIFPSLAFLVLWRNLKILRPIIILKCFALVVLGLFPYIYIPIAASNNPLLNWGEATNIVNFFNLITRHAYGWTSKLPAGSLFLPLNAYIKYFSVELPPILIVAAIFGVINFVRKKEFIIFIVIFTNFLISGPLFTFYGGAPIGNNFFFGVFERFYSISFIFLILLVPFGITFVADNLIELLGKMDRKILKSKNIKYAIVLIFFIIPVFLFITNFKRTDLHNVWIGDYFSRDIFTSAPKNSLIFFTGDTALFNNLYIQNAYKFRKDANIVTAPGLESFIKKNKILNSRLIEILKIHKKIGEQDAFLLTIFSFPDNFSIFTNVTGVISDKYAKSILFMPMGLGYKVASQSDRNLSEKEYNTIQKKIWQDFKLNSNEFRKTDASLGYLMLDIQENYAKSAVNIGDYLTMYYGAIDKAKEWYEMGLSYYPEEDAYKGLGYYYYQKNNCKLAEENIAEILAVDPKNKLAYKQMFLIYSNCYKNHDKAEAIKNYIKKNFGEDVKS